MRATCPKTGKRKFKSPGQARRSASQRGMLPCRIYRCPFCDGMHITSNDPLRSDVDYADHLSE